MIARPESTTEDSDNEKKQFYAFCLLMPFFIKTALFNGLFSLESIFSEHIKTLSFRPHILYFISLLAIFHFQA